jgi:hypothetical protein
MAKPEAWDPGTFFCAWPIRKLIGPRIRRVQGHITPLLQRNFNITPLQKNHGN